MELKTIDINADLGEGIGNEQQLMPLISSCNVACGGHAGDEDSMRKVVKLAKLYDVKIGAHPSYPDTENFGRKALSISCATLFKSIQNQINDLVEVLQDEKAILHHVKPHGALYNMAMTDEKVATVIVEVMQSMYLPVYLYIPCNSVIEKIALAHKLPIIYEAFADRNYNENLTLVSRDKAHAVLQSEDEVFQHVFRIVSESKVKTITGKKVDIKAHTFCIHGDHPKAVGLLNRLKHNLELKGIRIQ